MPIPRIFNETIAIANDVHTYAFPGRIRGFQFQARTAVDLTFAWRRATLEAGTYMTLKSGSVYSHDESEGAAIIEPNTVLYFACATVGTVVEIEVW